MRLYGGFTSGKPCTVSGAATSRLPEAVFASTTKPCIAGTTTCTSPDADDTFQSPVGVPSTPMLPLPVSAVTIPLAPVILMSPLPVLAFTSPLPVRMAAMLPLPLTSVTWIEYVSLKILAQAMNDTRSTDNEKLIAYFETQAQFDVLKGRKAYFRSWDHQMMQEAYPFTVKAKGQAKDKVDFLKFGDPVPAPNQPLEVLAPTKAENACRM